MQIIHAPVIIIHHLVSVSNNTRTVQHKVHHDTGAKCVVSTSSLCFACHTPYLSHRHCPCHVYTHWLHVHCGQSITACSMRLLFTFSPGHVLRFTVCLQFIAYKDNT